MFEVRPYTLKWGQNWRVQFAGVHSNVGGGYPRSGLSDVALAWMMERASHHGLVFIDDVQDAVEEAANVQGKLYDSRDGFGVYYRYQPRIIDRQRLISVVDVVGNISPSIL